jgi:hypothetical protein
MCRSNRAQRLQQQQLLESSLPINSRPRGCCSRKQQRVRRDLEDHAVINYRTTDANKTHSQAAFGSAVRGYHCPMAAMIAVGIGMGVEKLGRKISEKRIERKDKKAATVGVNLILICIWLRCNAATRGHVRSWRVFKCACGTENQRLSEAGEERGSVKRARVEWEAEECEFGEDVAAGLCTASL